jgi:hypothetical protein
MRSVVLIHGLLRGMEREATCEMLAMKEAESGRGPVLYSRCSVIDAPMDLPDGDYTVSFNGCVVSARKEGGLWMPDEVAVRSPATEWTKASHQKPFRVEGPVEILPALNDSVA